MSSVVTINGKRYVGNSIIVTDNQVLIDGKSADGEFKGIIELKIEGHIESLRSDCNVSVVGSVGQVDAGGSVNCGAVSGSVTAGGSINAGAVGGGVRAGGSVNHR